MRSSLLPILGLALKCKAIVRESLYQVSKCQAESAKCQINIKSKLSITGTIILPPAATTTEKKRKTMTTSS
ncbi:hypothetical protein BDB00DRAFT_872088 [Zychaea mexicana]|uniref:uncharacterized protein n=1 Tax=Zychaea mexicana TaxID=64656 RepID=UPI0022FE54E2|nr:uncharacterized protein BDB00DRAFT_872088 [Zychaea mexicana]KAI9493626.1 hypothetical protein BDB00DRAFT_872088 [Zychaea mexicana]